MNREYKLLRSVIMLNIKNGQPQKNNVTALSKATGFGYSRVNVMVINMKNTGVLDISCAIAYPVIDKYGNMKQIIKNNKPVVGVNKKTGNQIRFHSAYAAAVFLKIKRSNITGCCNCYFGRKSAGGYEWRFEYE